MVSVPLVSGQEVVRAFERLGWEIARQRGSHIIMQKITPDGSVTVPVPNHRTVRAGTLLAIIRQSGVAKEHFLR